MTYILWAIMYSSDVNGTPNQILCHFEQFDAFYSQDKFILFIGPWHKSTHF